MQDTQLSQAAYERLREELDDLTTRGRIEVANRIQTARELGDLSENADYHAAREDQGRMELRIRQLTQLLDKAQIIQGGDSSGRVTSGSIVSLRYQGDDEVERYLVGNIEERRDDLPVISPASPLGKALMGRSTGDQVDYDAPRATLTVEILDVEG
jgi:transcription elongation factor GreA